MPDKTDLEEIDINSLNDFVNRTPIPSEQLDDNNSIIVAYFNTMIQVLDAQMPQTGVATEYTAEQDFQDGILTDTISNSTANTNLALSGTGTGIVTASDATYVAGQILTTANINALYGTGGAAVMAGATSVANGTAGLAPQPLAGEQNEALMGDATYRPVVRSTVDTLNTGAMAAGQSFVGTGANATAPDYVITSDAAMDLTGTPSSGMIPIASSSSAAVWTTVTADTFNSPLPLEGMLTLTSGLPITTADVTAATSVKFTPYGGNRVALYTGSVWVIRTFSELSLAVAATTATNYDDFIYDNAGTVAIESLAWTNDTTRATAITYQDGVWIKSGDATRRYVGSHRTTAVSGQTEDSFSNRLLFRMQQIPRPLRCRISTASWTYATNTLRPPNADSAVGSTRVTFLRGLNEKPVTMRATSACNVNSALGWGRAKTGIGLDSTTTDSSYLIGSQIMGIDGSFNTEARPVAVYEEYTSVGYHYLQQLEALEVLGGGATYSWSGSSTYTGMVGMI